jgi:hypothetical protein
LQIVALVVVAVTGTMVVLIGETLRQALALGFYGLTLTLLFLHVSGPGRGAVGDRRLRARTAGDRARGASQDPMQEQARRQDGEVE